MFFNYFLPLFALARLALGQISILSPNTNQYWVQNDTKEITWTSSSGAPSTFDVQISNINNTTLNGNFSIARNVNTTAGSVLITNVTLVVGSGYQVIFVNGTNPGQAYTASQQFQVMPAGTVASAVTTANSSTSGNSSSNSTSSNSSLTTSSTSTSSSASGSPSNTSSGIRAFSVGPAFGAVLICMIVGALSSLVVL